MDQIAVAHIVVCNKIDDLSDSQIDVMHQIIRRMNNWCTIVDAFGGDLDVRYIIDPIDPQLQDGFESYHRDNSEHQHNTNIRQHTYHTESRLSTSKLQDIM